MTRLILASGSESRRRILTDAGVAFEVRRPTTNEAKIKSALMAANAAPDSVAVALAVDKAMSISMQYPEALVIGADQIAVCSGRMFDKAATPDAARDVLATLRGREHSLVSAVVLTRDADLLWRHIENARLWMRAFSNDFLERYLVNASEDILSAVGCYHVEGRGIQLFDRIEGDHFTIRGLPLIPLLAALREQGVLPS